MRDFQMSWTFVLEPVEHGRTRLERFWTRITPGPATLVVGQLFDVSHFLMTRKQLLGIRDRAERQAITPKPAAAPEEPTPVG